MRSETRAASVRRVLLATALLASTTATYCPLRTAGFVNYDDPLYVTANPQVQRGLTFAGVAWAFRSSVVGMWHPLTLLSHMAVVSLGGLDPRWHHGVNVLLHAANAIILLLLLERATGAPWPSALVAFLFALHPLHVESVAWVAERKDVLSTCFGLLAIAAYVSRLKNGRRPVGALVIALFACSLMAKPMLVTLPVLLLLLDWWPLGRVAGDDLARAAPALVREKLPLVPVAAAAAVVAAVTQREVSATSLATLPLGDRIGHAVVSYVRYIGQTCWPTGLAVFYPYPHVIDWTAVAAAAVLLAALTIATLVMRTRAPYLLVGWLWFLLALLPVIGLVQVGMQAAADRYTYVPLIGLAIAAAWSLSALAAALPRATPLCVALAIVTVTACALGAARQTRYWHDDIALYRHALAVTFDNFVAHNNLGLALLGQGAPSRDEAATHFEEAIRVRPAYAEAHNNLGGVRYLEGRRAEAIAQFTEALRLRPDFTAARDNLHIAETSPPGDAPP